MGNLPIAVRPVVSEFGCRNSCRILFNKAFVHSEGLPRSEFGLHPEAFRKWEEVKTKLFAVNNVADIITTFRLIEKLDVQGLHARWKYVNTLRSSWTTSVVEWYRRHAQRGSVDVAAEEPAKDQRLCCILGWTELLIAGSNTTASAMEWAILELVRHPHVMERLQAEIDAKFGLLRPVDEDEAAQLPYLQAVVKEVLRLHVPAVLGFPHCNLEDGMLGGYHIPGRTAVIANIWAIHRDPSTWGDDALVFYPDRFLDSDLNVNGTNFQYLPFGAGRRICPGRPLAMRSLYTFVGSFVHAFELSAVPADIELDANEGTNGINIRPETPLLLQTALRPSASLYSAPNPSANCNAS